MIRAHEYLTLAALLIMGSAASAQAPGNFQLERNGPGMGFGFAADPSDIVSAEVAFALLAREKGQWTAFRKTADDDAVMFVPGIVNAQAWLKKRTDPPKSVIWSPDRVFVSCDGSYAVAHGHADYPNGSKGGYVTIWRRQGDGSYKWVLDWSTALPQGLGDEGAIDGKVADCPGRRGPGARGPGPDGYNVQPTREELRDMRKKRKRIEEAIVRIPNPPPANGEGQSADGTLRWHWSGSADGARALSVSVRYDGQDVSVIDDHFAAGQ